MQTRLGGIARAGAEDHARHTYHLTLWPQYRNRQQRRAVRAGRGVFEGHERQEGADFGVVAAHGQSSRRTQENLVPDGRKRSRVL